MAWWMKIIPSRPKVIESKDIDALPCGRLATLRRDCGFFRSFFSYRRSHRLTQLHSPFR
ncbi:hypothetical protein EV677_2368 [Herminiimonas fonticola]|uniref:Uncharacterized protein n=1 Tax=Herminiimonas fonticola TaxID=303380 RepID=A0A4R6G733_9BURK|nr:hypothetical protein Hfont_2103 [Herminiimonas fonticola]TDN90292.1 hypothetical protein EV677_2368 [Herminiimonas fonticola]